MARNCETGDGERSRAIEEFLAHHRQDGLVVFFYEYERGGPDPCRVLDKESVVYRPGWYSCLAVVEARGVSSEQLREF